MAREALNDSSDWPHRGPVFRSDRWIPSPGETTQEMAVGVTRLDAEEAAPEQLLQYVRGPMAAAMRTFAAQPYRALEAIGALDKRE